MKKIVSVVQPFDLDQVVIAYEDGNKIGAEKVVTADVSNAICKMAKKFDIKEINLVGPKAYAKKIGRDIEKNAAAAYDLEQLEIKYL